MAAQRVLIKKYENRRLYDATNSRYVNLEEVAQLVQQGNDVQVVDAASGEDITRMVLTQIIAEGAKTPESNFPLDILRQMVIASGRASQESAIRYTKAMLDLYQSTYRAMAPALNPFDFLQNAAGPAASQQTSGAGSSPPGGATGGPSRTEGKAAAEANSGTGGSARSRDVQGSSEELSRLKQRLAELEKAVSSMAPAGAATPAVRKASKRPVRRAPARKK